MKAQRYPVQRSCVTYHILHLIRPSHGSFAMTLEREGGRERERGREGGGERGRDGGKEREREKQIKRRRKKYF